MKYKLLTTLLFTSGVVVCAFSQEIWTIGPAIHVNFARQEKVKVSYAIEFAYWNLSNFYHSIDGGFEYERNKVRLYSEIQTGFKVGGISCGPVIEFSTQGEGTHVGIQGSVWTNYFVSTDFRKRWINHKSYTSFGLFAPSKFLCNFPAPGDTWIVRRLDCLERRIEENNKKSANTDYDYNNTGSSSWDWD
jgi:hypothetical protein